MRENDQAYTLEIVREFPFAAQVSHMSADELSDYISDFLEIFVQRQPNGRTVAEFPIRIEGTEGIYVSFHKKYCVYYFLIGRVVIPFLVRQL